VATEVNGGHERFPIERDGAIGVAHDHRRVEEDETVFIAELDNLVPDLFGPSHVGVSDGP
jgi:hypothetical protein